MDELETLPDYRAFASEIQRLKRDSHGAPYWMARDVQAALEYGTWENFRDVLLRARQACESAGVDPDSQFRQTTNMVSIGSGAQREREDWYLSKYACYLIAMTGDSSKKEIAYAKTYFAIQTHRQEAADELTDNERRIKLRQRVSDNNVKLLAAAKQAGVLKYAVFNDAGYQGLYAGLGQKAIKAKKGIPEKEKLLDCIGATELAANDFRITQTKDKLERDRVRDEEAAFSTHREVGAEVRAAMKRLGGTMPEDLKSEPPIQKLISARNKALKRKLRELGPKS